MTWHIAKVQKWVEKDADNGCFADNAAAAIVPPSISPFSGWTAKTLSMISSASSSISSLLIFSGPLHCQKNGILLIVNCCRCHRCRQHCPPSCHCPPPPCSAQNSLNPSFVFLNLVLLDLLPFQILTAIFITYQSFLDLVLVLFLALVLLVLRTLFGLVLLVTILLWSLSLSLSSLSNPL